MASDVGTSAYVAYAAILVVVAVLLAKICWPIVIGLGFALYFGLAIVNGIDGRG